VPAMRAAKYQRRRCLLAFPTSRESSRRRRAQGFKINNVALTSIRCLILYVGERQQLARTAVGSNDRYVLTMASFLEKFPQMFSEVGQVVRGHR
jgi:urease gamma subunit